MDRLLFLPLLVFLLTVGFSVHSQDTTAYLIRFSGAGNINKTSVGTTYVFNNSLRFSVERPFLTFNASGNWLYGENTQRKTNNDFLNAVDIDLYKNTRKLYYWALGNYEKSYSLKIQNRIQAGAGIGYNLLKNEKGQITLSDGILYESTSLREMDKYGRLQYETVRNSFRLKYRFQIGELIILEGVNFFQNAFKDGQDYILRTNNLVNFKLTSWLGLNTSFTYNKYNLTSNENLLFTYGLVIEKRL
ncbi:DUF481 domain-containing protein [Flavihumibacter sp. ZG627]|uniref:DUF481 domain-containing protein n=1 Tax=Flavihumibacter sp. ZG627 TaxID=1463156 RepID=UPI00057E94C8|nr:DUF481 domain-containing protein [Flavihumibacter sp. ZG627]KIC91437.1 hypothetical protein HY58_04105 [Flavihumibacter sp. ZG627]